jgi:hypothetical protein
VRASRLLDKNEDSDRSATMRRRRMDCVSVATTTREQTRKKRSCSMKEREKERAANPRLCAFDDIEK